MEIETAKAIATSAAMNSGLQVDHGQIRFMVKVILGSPHAKKLNTGISASIGGTAEKPIITASLPLKLKHKIVETPGTTVITVTHVLNSTDPEKIAACAKNDAKGSYLCEFSDQCVYEAGYCLPK